MAFGTQPGRRAGEAGYLLIGAVVMVALVLIALSVAAPVVARELRRDKEIESQHRMEQYVRAIQLFTNHGKGAYPASIKALENTNNKRFLRHVYIDPLTGKADYRLIHQGEQKTKIHVFFGQELDGFAASLGSAASLQSNTGPAGASSTSTISSGGLAGGFNGASITSTSGATGSTGASGSTGSTGSTDSGTGIFGDSTGGIIVGVGTSKSGNSVTEPNGQTTYETWEFWYNPKIELLKANVNIQGGGGGASTSASSFGAGSASTFGQGLNGQSNGANGASGATGSTGSPSAPTTNPFP